MSYWDSPRESWFGVALSAIDGLVIEQNVSTVNTSLLKFRGRNFPKLSSVKHYNDVQCGCGENDKWPGRNEEARIWAAGAGFVLDVIVAGSSAAYLNGHSSTFFKAMAITAGVKIAGQALGGAYHVASAAYEVLTGNKNSQSQDSGSLTDKV